MSEKTVIAVFPSIYSLSKINNLVKNISEILRIKNQPFSKLRKNGSIIVVDAVDPVLASSVINLMFGIDRVAIAKEVVNDFDSVLSAITSSAMNLLMKGETFHVKIEGETKKFLAKDLELAATTALIERSSGMGVKPSSEADHNRLIYTFLTDSHAYVCIFVDRGLSGLPYNSNDKKILCCIYDELSAICCLQTIKMGFDVEILICYRNDSELLKISKMLNRILPKIIKTKVALDIYKVTCSSNLLTLITTITHVMISNASKTKIKRIALSISPMIFPISFLEYNSNLILQNKLVPWIPLSSIDSEFLESAKEIGLEKYVHNLEDLCKKNLHQMNLSKSKASKCATDTLKTWRQISINAGPKIIHDIIDLIKSNH